jgi:hypothetical protein
MVPTQQVVKRLFAISGNKCAFPNCKAQLISEGTVVGEICHIKASSPEGPRYDASQENSGRGAYDNLLLLCATHHKVIDDDTESYTVDRLKRMKVQHEASAGRVAEPDAANGATLLLSMNQSGGIAANSIFAHTINVQSGHSPAEHDAKQRALATRESHKERCRVIAAGTGAVALLNYPALIIDVVPYSAVGNLPSPQFENIARNAALFPPTGRLLCSDVRFDYNGMITGSNQDGLDKPQRAYVQVFRDGTVEAVVASIANDHYNCLILPHLQAIVIKYAMLYTKALENCSFSAPFEVLVSLVGTAKVKFAQDFFGTHVQFDPVCKVLENDKYYFGQATVEAVPPDIVSSAKIVRSILDLMANTTGSASSPYFDDKGNYTQSLRV